MVHALLLVLVHDARSSAHTCAINNEQRALAEYKMQRQDVKMLLTCAEMLIRLIWSRFISLRRASFISSSDLFIRGASLPKLSFAYFFRIVFFDGKHYFDTGWRVYLNASTYNRLP